MRRILIISHVYVAAEHRGKLRALAAGDLELTVGVPQRWKQPPPGLDHMVEATWERQSGVEIFPIPVGDPGDLLRYRFGRRALAALIRDKRPDLIQVEEEATSAAARQVTRIAAGLDIPVVLFGAESQDHRVPLAVRWRRRRTLRQVRGLAGGGVRGGGAPPRAPRRRSGPGGGGGGGARGRPGGGGGESVEPHGHALVEAMAHEVVVVGTTAGVIPEVVGEAGVTVPPDDASSLAEALRSLGPVAARLPLAQAGRARGLKLFRDGAVAERTGLFWGEVLEPSPIRP